MTHTGIRNLGVSRIRAFCLLIGVFMVLCACDTTAPIDDSSPAYFIRWDSELRVTSHSSPAIYPAISVDGSTIHLAWVDRRDGGENREIYYNRSDDLGVTWQVEDVRISNDPMHSIRPNIVSEGATVHLFWTDNRGGAFQEYYVRSADGGNSWGPETRLTDTPGFSGCPYPTVAGDVLNLFFRDSRSGTFQIYQKRSTDSGITWSADVLLTPDGIDAEFPSPALAGEMIHLVWRDTRNGHSEIYYKRSTDGGLSWDADRRLTFEPSESEHPKIVVNGSTLHLVWRDNRDGIHEIYYMRSTDSGDNWSEAIRITDGQGQSFWPVLAQGGDLLHLLWCDDRTGTQGLYYVFSSDNGGSWSEEVRVADSVLPLDADLMGTSPMLSHDRYVHVTYSDQRTGRDQVYYRRARVSTEP